MAASGTDGIASQLPPTRWQGPPTAYLPIAEHGVIGLGSKAKSRPGGTTMQTIISTRAVRLAHQLRSVLGEMSYTQRRMFELRTGISSRPRSERESARSRTA